MSAQTVTSSGHHASSAPRRVRHPHDDAPDTAAQFAHLAGLEEGPERELLKEELAEAWLPMAHRIAGRFGRRGEELDDLRQVAALGLVKAIDHYEPGRGAFESYAVPTITGEIKRHFRDRSWALRVPRRVQELRNRIRVAHRELSQQPGAGEPRPEEIAEYLGITEDEVKEGMQALHSHSTLSLDARLGASDDDFSLADMLGSSEPGYDTVVDREAAKEGLRMLPERERKILYLRFFEDKTQQAIADQLDISQMHVSRLITRSCAKVRARALGDTDAQDLPRAA
ncbi:SigB/SigF/SigG family RNA polymerase sigma factor [Streptomyces sp. TRM66268-LWL]|uniref:SigB/SigF/SigG family RNA polymerase sigma factor n=1 Tax=Streptomyces polyasparticus TaxID=2767826 RepID=A0ABR7SFE9_9ACTN|nr:SigB/SigF/SigG family RNA polymerase sigma factor [Streptomyces polyasparticus]MBC9713023.1 SigB/SigF/SigG family RNA polymerase sigma factor [Streptomyces polyasparticus]